MIQANTGIDPTRLDYEDWAAYYAKAMWLERWRLKNIAEMLSALFGSGK